MMPPGDNLRPELDEIVGIIHGLIVCLISQGSIDAKSLREDLERRAAWRKAKGATAPELTAMITHLNMMLVEKRDVDQRLAISIGVAPTQDGMRN